MSFRRQLRTFWIGALIALLASNAAASQGKGTGGQSPSQLLCNLMKIGCTKKAAKKTTNSGTKTRTAARGKKQAPLSLPPKPKPKPKIVTVEKETQSAASASKTSTPDPKVPHDPAPQTQVTHLPLANGPNEVETSRIGSDCAGELARLGVDFATPKDIEINHECRIATVVQLRSVRTSTGVVQLPGLPVLDCAFARQFVIWVADVAAPLFAGQMAANLSSVLTGTSYQCRRRNGDNSGRMSEHAFGNAVDIASFTMGNSRKIDVAAVDPHDTDQRLLMALRKSACGYFTTVLGPGSNAAHDSHFHFDLGKHGKSGNYRICEWY
jgi:hypothetical protein